MGILGSLEVAADGAAVEVAGGRLRALLIRLALEPGRAVSVGTLADALWAGDTPGDPVGAVQQLVSRLRRALPDGGVLRSTPAGYVLELPADAVDAVRFERLAAEGRRELRAGRAAEAGAVLRDALRLWRGAALADAADAPYAQGAAARLEELRLAAAEDRAEAVLTAGGDAGVPAELIAELSELEAAHPLRERIAALRMRALIADGRVAEALTVYAELRERLAGTLGVDPSPEVQAVHLAALRHRPEPMSAPVAGTNLRAPITSFVGREAERALLIKQLTEGRLVTLVGPGGAGKTRLATTVAHEIHAGRRSGRPPTTPTTRTGGPTGTGDRPAPHGGRLPAAHDRPPEDRDRPTRDGHGPRAGVRHDDHGAAVGVARGGHGAAVGVARGGHGAAVGVARDGHAATAGLARDDGLVAVGAEREGDRGGAGAVRDHGRMAADRAHDAAHLGARGRGADEGGPRGGVWLVELAPVAADGDVAQAALGALQKLRVASFGAARAPGGTIDRLVELLAPHDAVLVLDNCEHVVAGAARLADELLGSCPRLRIIATSRERLGIAGEALCPVPPLDLPVSGAGAAEALGWASVRLFRDRAVAVRPDFVVDATTVGPVVEVCRRLDGMPLAIELAAARLRALPIQEVVRRLDDRFALLTGGSRTALPRHRTLRAVVSWSWDLLDGTEALLAARLAVFPGAFTLADAEAVCDVPGDVLLSLVDRSLVQTASAADAAEPRYRMLDTIAAYAAERLDAAGGTRATRVAHARHFLALAEEAEPHLRRAEQLDWLARLDGAHDDLITALRFAADTGDTDTAVRLTAALGMYWIITGKQDEALEWCQLASAMPGPAPAGARVIVLVGRLMPRFTEADREAGPAEIRALLDALGDDDRRHPFLALIEAGLPIFAEDVPAALAVIERHLAGPDPWLRAMMHLIRSHVRENDGDPAGRRHELETAAGIFRDLGERMGLAVSLTELSEALSVAGEFDAALAVLDESITLLRMLNVTDDVAHQRIWRALIAARQGGPEHARAEFEAVLTECDLSGSLRAQSFANVTFGVAFAALGDLDRAESQLLRSRALIAAARTAPPQVDVLIDCGLAVIAAQRGDPVSAAALIPGAVAVALRTADVPVLARAGVALAFVRRAEGRPAEAAELLGAAEAIRGGPDRLSLELAVLTDELTAELGAAGFAAAAARGRARSRQAAIDLLPTP
ncbi:MULTISPECIES: AfsR/SARP family transcriptional regulator [Catenuloplanes]|uniref:ATPase/DNA-binding SARP family transcriptional activator n=1 Tax=Catenuloplanes niger TaxID=587534 RepID=A0AAE4CSH2_9ACTN|nr:BTAD domain-containing putative transcriptional regulator [Catenuloplanes niger]MDR7321283.1 putative ATPase/DNA-binding SARP family transcriptional activator [Catenuloplanes niger]